MNPFEAAAEGLDPKPSHYRFTVTIVLRPDDVHNPALDELAREVRSFGSLEIVDADLVGGGHPDHLDS